MFAGPRSFAPAGRRGRAHHSAKFGDDGLALRWGFSSAGRAPALQAVGRRFDPDKLHQIGWLVVGERRGMWLSSTKKKGLQPRTLAVWVSACSVDIVKRRRVLKGSTSPARAGGVGFCLELGAEGFITRRDNAGFRRECPHPAGFEPCSRKIGWLGFGRNGFPVTMIVPDRAISGLVSRSWSFVSSAYTGGTDKKSIAAGHEWIAHPSCLRCSNGMSVQGRPSLARRVKPSGLRGHRS